MEMQSDYPIYLGDMPGPTLKLVIDAGKLIVDYVPEVARKLQECIDRPPPEDGRRTITRLYGESLGRVYDAYRSDGLASSSSTTYSRYMGKLFGWMDDNNDTRSIAEVKDEFIEFLVASRKSHKDPEGKSVRRLAHYAVSKFMELCCEENSSSLTTPPPPPEPKPVTSEDDLQSLFDHVLNPCDLLMLFLVNVLNITTGKAVRLTWDDFDSNCEYLTIGVGEDAEKLEIDPAYRKSLIELRSLARSSYVLADSGGALPIPEPVTDRSLQYRFRRVAKRSGIPEWTTLTSTRKADAIASDLLEKLMNKYLPKFRQECRVAGDAAG